VISRSQIVKAQNVTGGENVHIFCVPVHVKQGPGYYRNDLTTPDNVTQLRIYMIFI
jgi:hypothetical protein